MVSLTGKTFLIARPKTQAQELMQTLEDVGATVVHLPLIEIVPLPHEGTSQELTQFDPHWIIFISPNAARLGLALCQKTSASLIAIGEGTAKMLQSLGATVALTAPAPFGSKALLTMAQLQQVQNQRIAIIRGQGGRALLGDTLQARGATVRYFEVYQRQKLLKITPILEKNLPNTAGIIVTNAEGLETLWQGASHLQARLQAVPFFTVSTRLADLLRQQGIQTVIVSAEASNKSLAKTILQFYRDAQ